MKKVVFTMLLSASMGAHAQLSNLFEDLKKAADALQSTAGAPANQSGSTPGAPAAPKPNAPQQKSPTPTAQTATPQKTIPGPAPIASAQLPIPKDPVLNLKGFNISITPAEAKGIVKSLQLKEQLMVGGKNLVTYSCGQIFTPNKTPCNFTFAGIDIHGMFLTYWGDEFVLVKFIYLTGTDMFVDLNNPKYGAKLKTALDEKYGVQNTNSNHKGDWIFGREKLVLEMYNDPEYKMWYGQLALVNHQTYENYHDAADKEIIERQKRLKEESKKKVQADM